MSNGDLDAIMNKIREQIVSHGGGGISGLSRKFKIADDNGDKKIDLKEEFPKMIKELNVTLTADEMTKVTQLLDRDKNGTINLEEFLYHFAPPMNETRIEWVNKVFDKLDSDKSGRISKKDLTSMKNSDAVFKNLCNICDKNGSGYIDREELIDYYREISPSIDNDEYFITMLKNAWKL